MRTSLSLTRRKNESIEVGDVTITVVRIGCDRVRLNIQAPPSVAIRRTEVEPIEIGAAKLIGSRLPVVGTNNEDQ